MERRRAARRAPEREEPLARVRLRTGSELAVVNVSNFGVLVEGPVRLLPGAHLDVRVITGGGRVLLRCRVIRSFVCRLDAETVSYRSALAFDRSIDASVAGYLLPGHLSANDGAEGTDYPAAAAGASSPHEGRIPA